jgi:hypothetical protein
LSKIRVEQDGPVRTVTLTRADTVRVIRARPPEGAAEPDATADAPPFGSGGFSRRTTA